MLFGFQKYFFFTFTKYLFFTCFSFFFSKTLVYKSVLYVTHYVSDDWEKLFESLRYYCNFVIGNRIFYFLIRYRITQEKSKINFPQFLRCMYVCVCVCLLALYRSHRLSYGANFFYHDICQHSFRCRDNNFVVILKFGGVMPLFSILSKNKFSQ